MFFTDAIGNKDTITLGYDVTASDSIDVAFGETNIISVPLDTNLDVRITNQSFTFPDTIHFHLKKQITYYDCALHNWNIQPINIFTHHWPVTVTWDNNLFNDSCRNGSVFTGVHPGGWWDTGSPSDLWRQVLLDIDSVTFTSNFLLGYHGYINSMGDSIPVFWQAFGDSTLLFTGLKGNEKGSNRFKVFPNPASNFISILIDNSFEQLNRVEIYDSFGQVVLVSQQSTLIDISELSCGLYFIRAFGKQGLSATTKFQKLN